MLQLFTILFGILSVSIFLSLLLFPSVDSLILLPQSQVSYSSSDNDDVSDATRCPSPIPDPSNPVGCILYSFNVSDQIVSPNSLGYDNHAQPNTVFVSEVGDGSSPGIVAVYYLNGTFFKYLISDKAHPLLGPQTSIVDISGYVFLASSYASSVYVFSPYPDYIFVTAITKINSPITVGLTSVTAGEYLGVSSNYDISLFRLSMNSTESSQQDINNNNNYIDVNVTATLVANTLSYPGYTYGGIFDPSTGQVVYIESCTITTLHFYTPIYTNPLSVQLKLNHTYMSNNSGLRNDSFAVSFQIDSIGRLFILSRNANKTSNVWGTLGLLLLNANGTSATPLTPLITTGISEDMAFVFMTINPDGSVIYIPDPQNSMIYAFQGFYTKIDF